MSSKALAKRAKDNPLSGSEKTFLVVLGVVVVGGAGALIYFTSKPAAAASTTTTSTPSAPVTTTTSPGSLSPQNVATDPSTTVSPGSNYIVAAIVAGLDLAGNPVPGLTPMTQSQVMAALGGLGWSNVSLIYWGPTNTVTDPNGFMDLARIGAVKTIADRGAGKSGVYVFTSTYTGPAQALPSQGVTAYKIG